MYLGELSDHGKQAGGSEDMLDHLGGGSGDVGSEMEILRSRSLVTRAVLDAGLNAQVSPIGAGPVRYWRWLWSRRDPRLLERLENDPRAVETRLMSDAVGPRTYRVVFQNAGSYELWSGRHSLGRGTIGDLLSSPEVKVKLIPGKSGVPRAGSAYTLTVHALGEVVDNALDDLDVAAAKTPVGAEPVKVVSLAFSARSPKLADAFLERLMTGYLEERQAWKTENATAAGAFVTTQLSSMRETLDQIEKKLAEYRAKNRVVVLDNEAKAMIEQVGKYEEQRVAARLEVAALSDVKRALKTTKVPVEAFMVGEAKDTVLEGMAASLAKSRQNLADLETRFNPTAPNIREQRQQVEAQQAAVKNYIDGRLSRARNNLGTLDGVIGKFEERLRSVPGAELGLTQLTRESEVYSALYSYLLKRKQQTEILKASTVSKNRILDTPQAPYREHSPKLLLRLASAPLGFLLGAIGVVLWGLWGRALQSESDVKRLIGSMPVFGRLPKRKRPRRRTSESLTTFDFPKDSVDAEWIEACRTLRTNLYHASVGTEHPVFLVTSPSAGDGKTVCVLSLAEMFAADGKAALVIEADLRRQRRPMDADAADDGPDLRDVLQGLSDWHDAVRLVPAPLGEFHVLMANDVGSAELLSGSAMRDLLRDVKSYYDVILLDVSSFPLTSDALVLCPLADCILSVVRLRSTQRRTALAHFHELDRGVPQALVLNDLEPTATEREKAVTVKQSSYTYTEPVSQVTIPVECLATTPQSESAE
jgi:uncharacterized protein involved in exopolysaccharide biosynthesis/Mrp family chromosome partitioning ATPase